MLLVTKSHILTHIYMTIKSKQVRVPTFVCPFLDDTTTAKGLRCDEEANLRLRDIAVVLLMPIREETIIIINPARIAQK